MSNARLEIRLDTQEPVELIDLAVSFQALAFQYKKHLSESLMEKGAKSDDADVKLYVTKIESGSIIAELGSAIPLLGEYFSIMDHTNIFIDFVKNIKTGIDYFKGLSTSTNDIAPRDIRYTKAECRRFSDILDVATKSKGVFGVSALDYSSIDNREGREIHLSIRYESEEAHAAQRGALIAQKLLEHRGDADFKKVLMYFYQTNIDNPKSSGRTSDKAVIKLISDKPLPVFFVSNLDQQKIRYVLDDPNENPFKLSFVVDVNVETDRNEIPRFYRVISVDEIIREEDQEDMKDVD